MILQIGETKQNKAFSLIEILLVIIITGIILAIAVPNFSKGYSRFQLNKTSDDLLTISRWAQAMAIGQERIYALSFSDDHRSYDLQRENVNEDKNGELSNDPHDKENFKPVNGTLGKTRTIPDSINIAITQTGDSKETGNADTIKFYPDGTIDEATIQLTSHEQKTILSSTEIRGMMTKVNDE